jgi:hypothetical protein
MGEHQAAQDPIAKLVTKAQDSRSKTNISPSFVGEVGKAGKLKAFFLVEPRPYWMTGMTKVAPRMGLCLILCAEPLWTWKFFWVPCRIPQPHPSVCWLAPPFDWKRDVLANYNVCKWVCLKIKAPPKQLMVYDHVA